MEISSYSDLKRIIIPEASIIRITGEIDLKGDTMVIPSKCTLDTRIGTIKNGTIELMGSFILCNDTQSLNCHLKGLCLNSSLTVNNRDYGASHIGVMGKDSKVILNSDIITDNCIRLHCSVIGNKDVSIIASNKPQVLISIAESGVSMKDVGLVIDNDTEEQKCYAIYATDVGKLCFNGLRVKNGSIYIRNINDTAYRDYEFSHCYFSVDHSRCNQDLMKQNDVFEFRGIQNVHFLDNVVEAHNVTRVFKIPSGGKQHTPCDHLYFSHNSVFSNSKNGKQVFDFYDLTRNVFISDNRINVTGHSVVFENKTQGDISELVLSIENNNIEYDYALIYLNLSCRGNNKTIIRNNTFKSTSKSSNRKYFQGDSYISIKRNQDLDFRNLNTLELANNMFSGVGLTESSLLYGDSINSLLIDDNIIDYCWPQVIRLNNHFDRVQICRNEERLASIQRNVSSFVLMTSATVDEFIAKDNATENHSGSNYILQHNSHISSVIISNNKSKKGARLISVQKDSKIIDYSSDGILFNQVSIPSIDLSVGEEKEITVSVGTVKKEGLAYDIPHLSIEYSIKDSVGSTVIIIVHNNTKKPAHFSNLVLNVYSETSLTN